MDMWKESYRLGIENIDAQHKRLFEQAGVLVREIEGEQRKDVYKDIVCFLQEYVLTHFQAEETYFTSIQYLGQESHKKEHREFTNCVKKYAKELEQCDYELTLMKKLAGMLGTWLIYHVVKEDLKYTGQAQEETAFLQKENSYMECFINSTLQVLETMVGLNPQDAQQIVHYDNLCTDDVLIEIGLVGELKGRVMFGFTKAFSVHLVESMMFFAPEEIDELVCSALAEVSNIASGNGTIAISKTGTACDICPPKVIRGTLEDVPAHEEVQIDTKIGKMTIALYLD